MTATIWAKIIYGEDHHSLIYTTNEFKDKTVLIDLYRHISDIKGLSGCCENLYESIEYLIKNKNIISVSENFYIYIKSLFEIFIIKFDAYLCKIDNSGIPEILNDKYFKEMSLNYETP